MKVQGDFKGPQSSKFFKQFGFWPFSDGNESVDIGTDKFSLMPNSEKEEYARKMFHIYWNLLPNKPFDSEEKFIDQVYYNDWRKTWEKNDAELGITVTGELVARWINISYNSWEKLTSRLSELAKKTPGNSVPLKRTFHTMLADTAKEITPADFVKITQEAVISTAQDASKVAAVAIGGYATYKLIALGVSLATLLVLFRKKGANS